MAAPSWKRDFASGLIVLLPVFVTAYVLVFLYDKLAAPLAGIITVETLTGLKHAAQTLGLPTFGIEITPALLNFVRVATTLVVFVLLVFSIGYLMRTTLGDFFERALDDLMNRVPGLRMVYNASKMAVETVVSGTEELKTPVKVETWTGARMTAFKTGKYTSDGREVIFLPTAPNITTGFVLEVHPGEYEEVDERVEDALTRILSAGFGDTDEENSSSAKPVENDGADDE